MKLLLLDSNSLVNRAYYAMPNLRTAEGVPTGGVYGFMSMLARLLEEERPTHIACAFDVHQPTFRHLKYAAYKAGRHPTPEDLLTQIPMLKRLLTAMNIPIVELGGYEADDILGTLSAQADMPVVVVSGDKDVLQLVSDKVTVFHTKRGITDVIAYTPARLAEEGLAPWQVPELKGLMGDTSDNIKGVAGVGEKTARQLLADYGSIDGVYSHVDEIKGKLRERLVEGKEDAYFSRDLATICRTVPLTVTVADCRLPEVFPEAARQMMVSLDFKRLTDRFPYEAVAVQATDVPTVEQVTITDRNALGEALSDALYLKTLSVLWVDGCWHFAYSQDREFVVQAGDDLFATLTPEAVLSDMALALARPTMRPLMYDAKAAYYAFGEYAGGTFTCDDLSLAAYVCDSGRSFDSAEDMLRHYGFDPAAGAAAMLTLWERFTATMAANGVTHVYTDIELPLTAILYDMERTGFRVDVAELKALGDRYTAEIAEIRRAVFEAAGQEFNLNSPKQLAEVLFDRLGLPTDKKRSTGADKLEKLSLLHPVVPLILRYRQISKLQSTYVSGLLPLLDGADRLHTVFRQAVTATGRLSSTEPNLQNIPVRTPEGKQIRAAFVASPGNKLVVADYSQIELRLMAHFSGDANMVEAYMAGQDIHAATAARVYGVPLDEVTPEMRSRCKAVNFGIIYGISDFGLSEQIGVSVRDAKQFIDKYFELYPGVRAYMHEAVETAKRLGYAATLTGRRRSIPELTSSVYNVRAFGERVAMNTPLQGTASDIIKLAMIRVAGAMRSAGLRAKMILQVHDELVVDCPEAEVSAVSAILKREMEGVMSLRVPLVAAVGVGDNWLEAK